VRKVDAATGKLLWDDSVAALLTDPGATPLSGYASRTTPVVVGNLVIFGTMRQVPEIITSPAVGAFLVAVDKGTGAFQWKIPLHGGNPAAIITGSPVVDGNMLYIGVSSLEEVFAGLSPGYSCCSFRGSVAAVNVSKASIVWQTPTISDAVYYAPPGGLGSDGGSGDGGASALSGYAGNAVWSSTPVIDRKLGQIYVTTGQNYKVPDGAQEKIDGNRYDAIMALDLSTGAVKWSQSFGDGTDIWTFGSMSGPDADFGAGANLFTAVINGTSTDLVGAGQKNGVYWAVDARTGSTVWHTQVGPGGHLGGVHWGTATDGIRVYVGVNNESGTPFMLGGTGPSAGKMTKSGAWAALDPANGHILWQIADPAMSGPLNGATVNGPVTVVNGVLFGGSMDAKGTMFALDASTGNVLWSFKSGATVYGGPAVSNGVVYWGSGYPSARLQFGTLGVQELFAFQIAN
ncbi:MAG: PQQ-binding-like beta-propeller repeat protein, partial [Polyangiaceae bacterium]